MTEEEIDQISKQIDEISKGENEWRADEIPPWDEEHDKEEGDFKQELADQVTPLPDAAKNKSVTELSEAGSQNKESASRISKRSSKSYIIKLRQEIENEKEQRLKLENEIEQLKRISIEISSKLGLKQ